MQCEYHEPHRERDPDIGQNPATDRDRVVPERGPAATRPTLVDDVFEAAAVALRLARRRDLR